MSSISLVEPSSPARSGQPESDRSLRRLLAGDVVTIARRHETESGVRLVHLDTSMGVRRYVRDALLIRDARRPGDRILDLGCGAGHMAFLLAHLGLDVTASDVQGTEPYYLGRYREQTGRGIRYVPANVLAPGGHPLDGEQWDAVCLSGVLEHVPDFGRFLDRVRGLLQRDGRLFLFRFPNKTSWVERLSDRRFGNAGSHPLRFVPRELDLMLRWHGFRIDDFAYEEILPVNLRGWPPAVVRFYHGLEPVTAAVSAWLRSTPLVRQLSTSYRFVCTRARTKS